MLKKLDHVGIAVNSIEEALKFFRDTLGLKLESVEVVADQKVKIAFLPVGETHVELLEPTSPDSNVAKFLEKKGEGIHHIKEWVDDCQAVIEDYKKKGIEVIQSGKYDKDEFYYLDLEPELGILYELGNNGDIRDPERVFPD